MRLGLILATVASVSTVFAAPVIPELEAREPAVSRAVEHMGSHISSRNDPKIKKDYKSQSWRRSIGPKPTEDYESQAWRRV